MSKEESARWGALERMEMSKSSKSNSKSEPKVGHKSFKLLKEKYVTSPYYIFCVLGLDIADQVYKIMEEYAEKIGVTFHNGTSKKKYKKIKKSFAKHCNISLKELNQVLDCADDVTILVLSRIASSMQMFLAVELEHYENIPDYPRHKELYEDTRKKLGYFHPNDRS